MSKTLILLLLVTSFLLYFTFPTSNAHNITSMLAKYPKFSTFNHYLTATGLSEEINHGMYLTVCVVDNPTMRHFLTKSRSSTNTLRHILSLHVLQSYYDTWTLRHHPYSITVVPTLFSDNNHLVFGYPRWVHITDLNGGKVVKFSTKDRKNKEKTAHLISFVKAVTYNISVVQLSGILGVPRAIPKFNTVITTVMNNNVCKIFRKKLSGTLAKKIYNENVDSGLTIFCPTDYSFRKFLPRFEKLSEKDKNALLLFHAMPVYISLYMMWEANGRYETLASDEHNGYNVVVQNDVYGSTLLKTNVMETMIAGKLFYDQKLAIYALDDVLLPEELFKA